MSLFEAAEAICPSCQGKVQYELVHSINVDRRPDLRDEVLAGTFQTLKCESCGQSFRIEPQFTYIHMGGKLYLSAWPMSRILEWANLEKRGDESFLRFYGPDASPAAQKIGQEMTRRTVFGWASLREKIVAAELGLNDVTLELAKVAIQRWADGMESSGAMELRLIGLDEGNLVFGEFAPGSEQAATSVTAPRELLGEIDADAEGWQALRERLLEGSFVDAQRLQMTPTPA